MNFNLTDQIAGVRIFHAANFAEPVNIYVNDSLVIEGLKYGEVTNYLPLPKGRSNVKIRNTRTGELLYNQTLTIDGNKFITISAVTETGKVDLIVLEDVIAQRMYPSLSTGITQPQAMQPMFPQPEMMQPMFPQQPDMMQPMFAQMMQPGCTMPQPPIMQPITKLEQQPMFGPMTQQPQPYYGQMPWPQDYSYGFVSPKAPCKDCDTRIDEDGFNLPATPILGNSARLRFVHLSTNAPAVDVVLPNGQKLFTNTKYKQATNYIPVGAGTYSLNVVPTGTNQVVLTVPNVTLLPNESYTAYAIGLVNGNPPLEAVLLRDGI